MWDGEYGGWYAITDRSGAPVNTDKHAHGIAYAIEACLAVFAATKSKPALDMAFSGFEWLDAHAHDDRHGGYFGPLLRGGTRIAESERRRADHIGTPFGLKDFNVNKDVLGTFLYASKMNAKPSRIHERLHEVLEIVLRCFGAPGQPPRFLFHPDWTPASTYWRPSEAAQAAALLIEARPLTQTVTDLERAASDVVQSAFRFGWSKRAGALMSEGYADRAATKGEERNTPWWAQFELLKATEYLHVLRPDDGQIKRIRDVVRETIFRDFIDEANGGVVTQPKSSIRPYDRIIRPARWHHATRKGDQWKDASHEGRCLLRLSWLGQRPPAGFPGILMALSRES
jgi:mannose/cellobiose epimerase-like protein (N-acyl-D-glucosamine 2-epimerase family)